jgi:hypothetical protein
MIEKQKHVQFSIDLLNKAHKEVEIVIKNDDTNNNDENYDITIDSNNNK